MATVPSAPTPTIVDQLIKKGAMLHKLSVVDDKNNVSLLGTFLDDAHGPPSQSILNHLICRNEYEKNLPLVTSLDSFALIAYSKEKDYRRTSDFVGYLQGRKKAAKVFVDKSGTGGYLYPGPSLTTPDGIPCLRCYYESGRSRNINSSSTNKKRLASPSMDGLPAVPIPTGASVAKRARTAGRMPHFEYIPPDPISPSNLPLSFPSSSSPTISGEEGPVYFLGREGENGSVSTSFTSTNLFPPLLDPSQFPCSQDPRFKYVPPTPMKGQIPPPFYHDPDACPVIEGLTLTPDQAALASSAVAAAAAVTRLPPSPGAIPGRGGEGGGGGRGGGGRGGAAWGKDQKVAEGFYNQLKREKGTRNQSLVFHLRKLNNWVKAQLINSLKPAPVKKGKGGAGRELEVLDLACGKGGDFTKWREVSRRYPIARYVGVDIAKSSLVDAIGRYHQDNHIRGALGSTLTLACADLGGTDLVEDEVEVWEATEDKWDKRPLLDEDDTFDCITMQFALHYMFETEGRARKFLQVVATHLRKGGSFIATTVDARVVVEMLVGLGRREGGKGGEWVARLVDEKKRELCRLQVDDATYQQLLRPARRGGEGGKEEEKETPFCGLRYKFLLRDGLEENGAADAVNAPEWMIPLPFLEAAAKEYGLKLEKAQNFHELVEEHRAHIDGGRAGIRWVNYQGSISPTEWDIARIYVALKFTRI
ncbi:mrna cap guanine-n7 [Nannochloropsis oceanica]